MTMKNSLARWPLLTAASLCSVAAIAQDMGAGSDPNWFSIGPRFGFNNSVRFKQLGNIPSSSAPGPATGGATDRTYDDGYVKVDSSGNLGGQTWNWGYNNGTQVQGDTLNFHSASSAMNAQSEKSDDPQLGFELAYGRRLGKVSEHGSWGLMAAFNFTDFSIRDGRNISGNGSLITDSYALGGTVPPEPPYSHGATGFGPIIGDSPNRTVSADAVTITGTRKLEAQLYGLRLGPYLDLPITRRFSGRLEGGLSLALVDSTFSVNETLSFAGGSVVSRVGSASKTDVLAGGYIGGDLSYTLTQRTSVFTGAQYQYLGTFSQTVAGEKAELDLAGGIYLTFGLRFGF